MELKTMVDSLRGVKISSAITLTSWGVNLQLAEDFRLKVNVSVGFLNHEQKMWIELNAHKRWISPIKSVSEIVAWWCSTDILQSITAQATYQNVVNTSISELSIIDGRTVTVHGFLLSQSFSICRINFLRNRYQTFRNEIFAITSC